VWQRLCEPLMKDWTNMDNGVSIYPGKPKRLDQIFQSYDSPLYFITLNTRLRRRLLARDDVHSSFCLYAEKNAEAGRTIGRYVIMPDHLHFFVRIGREDRLSIFVQLLKQSMSKTLKQTGEPGPYWQVGFFDHVLRHSESYSEKWNYVRENPVRAGLVTESEKWPYQGEIARIQF
jgi:REP element-mobilizing transposase RayT